MEGIIQRRDVKRDRLLFRNNWLKDKDRIVRRDAMRALGILGNPRAVEPLIAAMKGEDIWAYELRETAAEALRAITGAGFGADPEEWQKWWDEKKERFIKEKQKEEVQK